MDPPCSRWVLSHHVLQSRIRQGLLISAVCPLWAMIPLRASPSCTASGTRNSRKSPNLVRAPRCQPSDFSGQGSGPGGPIAGCPFLLQSHAISSARDEQDLQQPCHLFMTSPSTADMSTFIDSVNMYCSLTHTECTGCYSGAGTGCRAIQRQMWHLSHDWVPTP